MESATVVTLAIHPVKDEPGVQLQRAQIVPEGVTGDRRKKRPLHLVGREETPLTARANLFLDASDADLVGLVGSRVAVGSAVLHVTEEPRTCTGVYAEVVTPGEVAVGDTLRVR